MVQIGGPRLRAAAKVVGLFAIICLILPFIYSLPYTPRDVSSYNPSSIPLRILPLGDSITWGWQPTAQASGTNGYRAELLQRLTSSGYTVDFVGTQHSGDMADNDNEGHSGFTISEIQGAMSGGLDTKPNVVLLHAGTNDLNRPEKAEEPWDKAPERLGGVIDDIYKVVPDALVIVAQIIQAENAQTETNIKTFNDALPGLVKEKIDAGHKITLVDQSVVGTAELIDGLHPTDAGYSHMGDVWFEGVNTAAEQNLISPAP